MHHGNAIAAITNRKKSVVRVNATGYWAYRQFRQRMGMCKWIQAKEMARKEPLMLLKNDTSIDSIPNRKELQSIIDRAVLRLAHQIPLYSREPDQVLKALFPGRRLRPLLLMILYRSILNGGFWGFTVFRNPKKARGMSTQPA